MLRIRKFEEAAADVFSQGLIPGLLHLYIGEEAVAVGVCAHLEQNDYVVSTHRGHGHSIAKGADVTRMMAELLGKATGYSKGRGGSMHMIIPEIGIMGSSGIVGAGIPIAAGLGLAIDVQATSRVAVAFFGDGASNTGTFHEGLNLAAVWKLPVVFVCENNMYAISVPSARSTAVSNIAARAAAYDIPGKVVDGMDVLSVYQAAQQAVTRARRDAGPTLLECKTYRFRGHYEGDPKRGGVYRSAHEMAQWEKKDPITNLRTRMLKKGRVTLDQIEQIEQRIKKEIEEAVEFAKASPYPPARNVRENVFATGGE
jgi:pyruvate dehydrogenase E1 component alpha subunit